MSMTLYVIMEEADDLDPAAPLGALLDQGEAESARRILQRAWSTACNCKDMKYYVESITVFDNPNEFLAVNPPMKQDDSEESAS